MPHALLVRGARQLITLRGPPGLRRGHAARELGVVIDGALLIRNGWIVEAGPGRRIENLDAARQAEELDAGGRIVLPGFIDSHTYLACATPRWNEPREDRSSLAVKALRAMQSRRLESVTRAAAAAMLRHGTTSIEAKSGFGLDEANEVKTLRVLQRADEGPWDIVRTFYARAAPAGIPKERHAEAICGWLPGLVGRDLAEFCEVNAGAFSRPQAVRILRRAAELKLPVKVQGDVELAVLTGAVAATLAGGGHPDRWEALARSATIATLLPSQYAGRSLIDRGAAVALATGYGPESPSTFSLQQAMAIACAEMGLTPEEAITAATINAAHSLRMSERIGSLEPGKQADLVLLNCSDYREIPYHFGVNHVHLTMKLGAVVYREGSAGTWPKPS